MHALTKKESATVYISIGGVHIGVPPRMKQEVAEGLDKLGRYEERDLVLGANLAYKPEVIRVRPFFVDRHRITNGQFLSANVFKSISEVLNSHEQHLVDRLYDHLEMDARVPLWMANAFCYSKGGRLPHYIELLRAMRGSSPHPIDLTESCRLARDGSESIEVRMFKQQLMFGPEEWTATGSPSYAFPSTPPRDAMVFGDGSVLFQHLEPLLTTGERFMTGRGKTSTVIDPVFGFRCAYPSA